ncbi:MAG: FAD-dependent oxidoreductase [Candidatus Kerfeldbacteria bacterium]
MKDLIIIGGSAAGTAAAVYAARRKLDFVMVSKDLGGEVALSGEVLNYPGFSQTTGTDLVEKFQDQLKFNEIEPETGVEVQTVKKQQDGSFAVMAVKSGGDVVYEAKAVIIATGVHPRHLGVPGEEEFRGKGVSYCTTCDGPLFKNKKVVTIGGGNSALESALMLAEIADAVTIINIHGQFKGDQVLIDKANSNDKVTIIYNSETQRIEGEMLMKSLTYKDKESGEEKMIEADGAFIHIGWIPNSDMAGDEVNKDKWNGIQVSAKMETNIAGLYAAGDVTDMPFKQIAIATGQGVIAALSAIEYVNGLSSIQSGNH